MVYTLGEAARATGKAKPTIGKAIKTGRLSAQKAADGSYRIDPAELLRVYPITGHQGGNPLHEDTPAAEPGEPPAAEPELAKWRALATERAETIRDLRERLDAEAAERRKLVAVLTDQRRPSVSIGRWRRFWAKNTT